MTRRPARDHPPGEVTHRRAGEQHEFVRDGEVVGRLVWMSECGEGDGVPGWVLQSPGWPDRQIYRVPYALAHDLDLARRQHESASLGIARLILSNRLSGLVPRARAHGRWLDVRRSDSSTNA